METYPLEIIDGHLVAEIGGRWFLVDTGAHMTFGEGGSVSILGDRIAYPLDLHGIISIDDVSRYVDPRIQAILGADVLASTWFTFDLARRQFIISRDPIPFEGAWLQAELFMGVPLIDAKVNGRTLRAVLDTGATICFLEPENLDGLESVGRKRDFFPTMGHFETQVYSPTFEFGGNADPLKTGTLPESLWDLLRAIDAEAILGTELLNYYDLCFALPDGGVYFRRKSSRADRGVVVSIDYDTPSSLKPDWTNAELVKRMLAGDAAAGNEFIDRYGKLIYSVLVRLCGTPEDHLEDAFNHVIVKLFESDCRRLRAWRGESALSTYLFAVTRNLGRDYREKEFRRDKWMIEAGDDGGEDMQDDGVSTPEDEVVVRRMEQVIRDLVESLEEICRKIIDLRFMRDMSYNEIALAAGITVGNVGVRLHRCLDALAQMMKREFPDLFEDRFNLDL